MASILPWFAQNKYNFVVDWSHISSPRSWGRAKIVKPIHKFRLNRYCWTDSKLQELGNCIFCSPEEVFLPDPCSELPNLIFHSLPINFPADYFSQTSVLQLDRNWELHQYDTLAVNYCFIFWFSIRKWKIDSFSHRQSLILHNYL